MAYIHSVTTALPPHAYATSHIAEMASAWLHDTPHEQALFARLCHTTKIEFSRSTATLRGWEVKDVYFRDYRDARERRVSTPR